MEKKTKRIKIKKDGGNVRADGVRVAGCVTETKPTGATATNQNVLRKTQGALVITRAGFAPLHRPSSSARQPWPANDIGHKYNRDRATEYYIHYDRGRPSQPFRPPAPPPRPNDRRWPPTSASQNRLFAKYSAIDIARPPVARFERSRPSFRYRTNKRNSVTHFGRVRFYQQKKHADRRCHALTRITR